MSKKREETPAVAAPPRRARVVLSTENLRKLMAGQSLTIRLRNIAGEEQLLELTTILRDAPQDKHSKSFVAQYSALLAKLDELLNKPYKGGATGNGKSGK